MTSWPSFASRLTTNHSSMQPVFITGGTGYTGRRLIARLLQQGYPVTALVRKQSLDKLPADCQPVLADPFDAASFAHSIVPNTLGGNIVNASPAADSPPVLLAYDAEVELVAANRSRWVPYESFHTGYKQTVMRPDELLARIRLPRSPVKLVHYYRKVGTRKAQAISKVCFAASARINEGVVDVIRIVLGSVAPIPLRCQKTEAALQSKTLDESAIAKARAELSREITPIDDIRSTRDYRLRVSLNVLEDFLHQLRST